MQKHRQWLTIMVASVFVGVIGIGARGGQSDDPHRLTAAEVIKLWEPRLNGVEDLQQFFVSPEESLGTAASTFRVVGPSFEELWNHYAGLCGIGDRYRASRLLMTGGTSEKGTYVVSDRASSLAKGGRALSVFLLRTDRYSVTATIQPDPDGKAMRGSIVAVTP